jgi:hypothetical protein
MTLSILTHQGHKVRAEVYPKPDGGRHTVIRSNRNELTTDEESAVISAAWHEARDLINRGVSSYREFLSENAEAWRSYPGERPHECRIPVRTTGVNPRDNGDRIAIADLFSPPIVPPTSDAGASLCAQARLCVGVRYGRVALPCAASGIGGGWAIAQSLGGAEVRHRFGASGIWRRMGSLSPRTTKSWQRRHQTPNPTASAPGACHRRLVLASGLSM